MGEPSWLTSTAPGTTPRAKTKDNTSGPRCASSPSPQTPAFKVVLVGEAGVGKTTLFSRMRQPEHAPSETLTTASIGVDTCTRTIRTRMGDVTVTVWDTAGAEQYRTLTRNYYRNSHAALLVFSVEDPASLYSLPGWSSEVGESSPAAALFLVGNKSDVDSQITDESVRNFADSHNCQAAFLVSAKTGKGVEEALSSVCEHLVSHSHQARTMRARDTLWLQGSGVQVHGVGNTLLGTNSSANKCCS